MIPKNKIVTYSLPVFLFEFHKYHSIKTLATLFSTHSGYLLKEQIQTYPCFFPHNIGKLNQNQ